jgi:recombination protein RecA
VKRTGTWYTYGDERLGQGRERVMELLSENPDLLNKIENEVREKLGFVTQTPKAPASPEAKPSRSKK